MIHWLDNTPDRAIGKKNGGKNAINKNRLFEQFSYALQGSMEVLANIL